MQHQDIPAMGGVCMTGRIWVGVFALTPDRPASTPGPMPSEPPPGQAVGTPDSAPERQSEAGQSLDLPHRSIAVGHAGFPGPQQHLSHPGRSGHTTGEMRRSALLSGFTVQPRPVNPSRLS